MKKKQINKKSGQKSSQQSGQSLLEFVIALFAYLTIVFMIVQVALGFGAANYIQYATFMSARAYLSGHIDKTQKRKAAEDVMAAMVGDRFNTFIKPIEGGLMIGPSARVVGPNDSAARSNNWEFGTRYKFKMKLYMLPIIKSALPGGGWVDLESESLLGSEPTEEDCNLYMQNHGGQGSPRTKYKDAMLQNSVDNGC